MIFSQKTVYLTEEAKFKSKNGVHFSCKLGLKLNKTNNRARRQLKEKKERIVNLITSVLSKINSHDLYSSSVMRSYFRRNNTKSKINDLLAGVRVNKIIIENLVRLPATQERTFSESSDNSAPADSENSSRNGERTMQGSLK